MRVCRKCFGLYAPDQLTCPKDGSPTQSHVDVLVGHQLGAYVVRSLIGEGGMGVVYAGEHPALGKRIALKVLRPELSLRDDIVERFVQEARAVNTIGHANIVNIYDFGRTPYGSFYFVMEFLDGHTIRQILDEAGPMPLEQIRMVVLGVGAALSAAHAKGFIHRDIKPENIMITSRGGQEQVKLLDFGIVKLLGGHDRRQTHTGAALGTPQYMCPEQLEESHIDHRADIFALGAVTYEMLTGMVPFPGKTHAEVRQLQLTRTPAPPSVARSESRLSRAMDGAVLWALALDPANRCKRMEDFISAFQVGYERTLVEQASPKRSGVGRVSPAAKVIFGAALALAVAAGGVGSYLAFRKPAGEVKADAGAQGTAKARPYSEAEAADKARKLLAQTLREPGERRGEAITWIKDAGRPVMLPELRAMLKEEDREAQKLAAQALAELGDRQSIPSISKLLEEASDPTRRAAFMAALAQLGDETSLEGLRKLADVKDPTQSHARWTALHALARLKDGKAVGWNDQLDTLLGAKLMEALGDLAFIGDLPARRKLEKLASQGDSWKVRLEAAEAISGTDDKLAKKVLVEALQEEHTPSDQLLHAARQLASLKDSRSEPVLLKYLRSPNAEDRRKSALALGRLGLPRSREHLAKALDDSSPDVVLAAAVALVRE